MASQHDVQRWEKGEDHWNKWAEGRLKAKEKLEKEGTWSVDDDGNGVNEETNRWIGSAQVDFSGHVFKQAVNFIGILFPHKANFSHATFRKEANFVGVRFSSDVNFCGATFQTTADFYDTGFSGNASFIEVTFTRRASFARATFSSDVDFGGVSFSKLANFNKVTFSGNATFFHAIFSGGATFMGGATFSKDVEFRDATFSKNTAFDEATFYGLAEFVGVTFSEEARFFETTFSKMANFTRATFSEDAEFFGATFSEVVFFKQCIFNANANFKRAEFIEGVSFNASRSDGSFSLAGATFQNVPNFIQMSFREPARLDDLNVVQPAALLRRGHKESAARYRALKKIAIESHDHVREQQFFAAEIKEQRGNGNDAPYYSAKFWFGLFYEILSNFGRTIALPLFWWLVSIVGFAAYYGAAAADGYSSKCKWPETWLLPELYLSFLHSLPIVGFGRGEKRDQALTCLFGGKANVSPPMDVLFIGQNIWSAVLIFLFLLAVRNHFMIK